MAGRLGWVGRQVGARSIDRGLHVARGRLHVAIERELQEAA